MEPVPDEAEGPTADLGIWLTPADSGVEEMTVPAAETPEILITKIQFILNKAPNNDSVPKMLQSLMKVAFPNGEAAIYPLDTSIDYPAITAGQVNKSSLEKYFDAWSHSKGLNVTLRVSIPNSLSKFKRANKELWKYLQDKSIFWHEDALAYAKEQSTPVFLYGVPTDGLNLKELALQIASQCGLEGTPFKLHAGNASWKETKSRVILVTCAKQDEKKVTNHIFDGLTKSVLKDETWRASPFPRIKPMTTRPIANHRLCKVTGIINALNDQAENIKTGMKVSYTQLGGLDMDIKQPNGDAVSLRKVFYSLSKDGKQTVYNIYRTGPGRVIFMINKHHIQDFTQKLELIFDSLQSQGYTSFEPITGYQDRPRRPSDPKLFPEHIANYMAEMNTDRSKVAPPVPPMKESTPSTEWPALVPKAQTVPERTQPTRSVNRHPAWQSPKPPKMDTIVEDTIAEEATPGDGMTETHPTPQAQENWMPQALTDTHQWSDDKSKELETANRRLARLEEELIAAKAKTANMTQEFIDLNKKISFLDSKIDNLTEGIRNYVDETEEKTKEQYRKIDVRLAHSQKHMESLDSKLDALAEKIHLLYKRKEAEDLNPNEKQLVVYSDTTEETPVKKSKPKKARGSNSPLLQRGLSLFGFDSNALSIEASDKENDSPQGENTSSEFQISEAETLAGGLAGLPLSIHW